MMIVALIVILSLVLYAFLGSLIAIPLARSDPDMNKDSDDYVMVITLATLLWPVVLVGLLFYRIYKVAERIHDKFQ